MEYNENHISNLMLEAKLDSEASEILPVPSMLKVLGTIDQLLLKFTGLNRVRDLKKAILEGSDVNAVIKPDMKSALHIAASKDDTDSVLALIEANANKDLKDRDGKTPLNDAGPACKEILKLYGAEGWSRLMVAAEISSRSVKKYFHVRSLLLSIEKGAPSFELWFLKKVDRFINSVKEEGKWDHWNNSINPGVDRVQDNDKESPQAFHEEKGRITKVTDTSEFSTAIGVDLKASCDICCCWEIRVENVRCMWLGVCSMSSYDNSDLSSHPSQFNGDFLIAFPSNGKNPNISMGGESISVQKPTCKYFHNARFKSGDKITFVLDMSKKELKMKINGILTCISSEIEYPTSTLHPYVCMRYNESATITKREHYKRENEQIPDDDNTYSSSKTYALDNIQWREFDKVIRSHFPGKLFTTLEH
jgi:hypothetical protein